MVTHQLQIESLLIEELAILALEKDDEGLVDGHKRIRCHFIPLPMPEYQTVNSENLTSNVLNHGTVERAKIVRFLFPQYDRFATQGYGFRLGLEENKDYDPTVKDLAPTSLIPPWMMRANQFARSLAEIHYRPITWADFAFQAYQRRELISNCLIDLQTGMIKYLERTKGFQVINYRDVANWSEYQTTLSSRILIPSIAVDGWGYVSEAHHSTRSAQSGSRAHIDQVNRPAEALSAHINLINAQSNYLRDMKNFFNQAYKLIFVRSIKKYKLLTRDQRSELDTKLAIDSNLANLATRNLWSAQASLLEYQRQFSLRFAPFFEKDDLEDLCRREQTAIIDGWIYWYFFIERSTQGYANVRKSVPQKSKLALGTLLSKIDRILKEHCSAEIGFTRKNVDITFAETNAMWILIDVQRVEDFYASLEFIINKLRLEFGMRQVTSLEDYLFEKHFKHIIFIPLLRGQMINETCYAPHFTILFESTRDLSVFDLSIRQITIEQSNALGIVFWDFEGLDMANRLAEEFAIVRLLLYQLSSFAAVPEESLSEHGLSSLQNYFSKKSSEISKAFQSYLDLILKLLDIVNSESECNEIQAGYLSEFLEAFSETRELLESFGYNGKIISVSLADLSSLVQKMQSLIHNGEVLRLAYVGYFLEKSRV